MRTFEQVRKYVLVFLVCTLSVTVLLKVGEVQYLELILAADFLILCGLFYRNGLRCSIFRPFFVVGLSWGIFLAIAFLLGVIALRQNFYLFDNTLFKRPLIVTLARMAELFLAVFYMLYLASLYREDEKLCIFGAKVFYWVGIAGGIYSFVTYPLNYFFDLQLGTYLDSHRMRGFGNEGGPYGIYLLGVFTLAFAMYHRRWLSRAQLYWGGTFLFLCLLGAQSKASFFAAAVLGLFYLMWSLKGIRRWAVGVVLGVSFSVLAIAVDIPAKMDLYFQTVLAYQQMSHLRSEDANLVKGRIAGAVLTPRMIAAHPILGIGWGNYALVRDDPEYRRGSAFSFGSGDSPSLGPIDYMVELGLPLWLFMSWITFEPIYFLRRHRADPWLLCMAAMQPISNWSGAHLNLVYPWVLVGLALGMGFSNSPRAATPEVESSRRNEFA